VDLVRVVGKENPVRIYELLARKGELGEAQYRELEQFHKALELYRQKKWAEAVEILQTLEQDPVAEVYMERCALYRSSPPPDLWDGIWELTKK
jgi:adenylate cyclase